MDLDASFGRWLKRRRKALDLTQAALAQRVGCSVATIEKVESDERRPSRQIAELLAEVLEIPPADRATFVKVARGERRTDRLSSATPTSSTSPIRRTNVPIPPTPLIGREAEMAALAALLLDPQCRLVTLVGPGGIGKTRLAIEAAAAQRDAFADGVYFVSLAPVSAAEFIVPAIAAALEFTFFGPTAPMAQLHAYLCSAKRTMLLVLDNFEHLLEGVDLVAEALQCGPGVKLLVTSRERLNLLDEWAFDLHGLPVPPSESAEGAAATAYSAVALFAQSARRVKAGFEIQTGDWPAVARVCRLVEGMPLAIELAAAWVRVLSCQEIAQEIERNLDFLAASARGFPERHRSMRAVFDHSWKLLTGDERRTLSQLSVFRGGFTREAAEQVAGVTLPVLSTLASKSLLHPAGPGRYDLHELMRQYAAGRLQADADEQVTAHERHYAFYLAQAEAARRGLHGPRQLEWLERLEEDHDNLRAALDWSLAAVAATPDERGDQALRLAGALRWFWHIHGHYHEGRSWLLKALHAGPESRAGDLRARARALEGVAWLTNALGDHGAARSAAEASAVLFRELGDQRGLAGALLVVGQAMAWQGEGDLSHARLAEALALYREAGDRWNMARALSSLGFVLADWLGDRAGRAMLEESAAILEELGDRVFLANVLISLGIVAFSSGDYAASRARLEQALAAYREISYPWGVADSLTNLGCVARTQGDYAAARTYLEEASRIYQERGSNVWRADPLCALAENDLAQGDLFAARARLQEASALAASSENRWLQTLVDYFLGLAAYYEGDNERAAALLEETAALAKGGQYRPDLARSLVALGRARRAQGDLVRAAALLREGLDQFHQLGHKLGMAAGLEGLAGLAAESDAERAARLFGIADAIRTAIGAPIPPVDRPSYESDVAAARAQLDEAAFAQAWAEGRTMADEQAISFALAEAGPKTETPPRQEDRGGG